MIYITSFVTWLMEAVLRLHVVSIIYNSIICPVRGQ